MFNKKVISICVIMSFISAFIAVFFNQRLVFINDRLTDSSLIWILAMLAAFASEIFLMAYLRSLYKQGFGKAFGRIAIMLLLMLAYTVIAAIVSGILSIIVDSIAPSSSSKLAIDIAIMVFYCFVIPFLAYFFWLVIKENKKIGDLIKKTIRPSVKRYFLLLLLMGVESLAGFLINIAFSKVLGNVFMDLIFTGLIGLIASVALLVSFKLSGGSNEKNC